MKFLVFFVALVVSAQCFKKYQKDKTACLQETHCTCLTENGMIDLRPLANDNVMNVSAYISNFFYNPCKVFSMGSHCKDVLMCQRQITGTTHAFATTNNVTFGFEGKDLALLYTHGRRTAKVRLVCDEGSSKTKLTFESEAIDTIKLSMASKYACAIQYSTTTKLPTTTTANITKTTSPSRKTTATTRKTTATTGKTTVTTGKTTATTRKTTMTTRKTSATTGKTTATTGKTTATTGKTTATTGKTTGTTGKSTPTTSPSGNTTVTATTTPSATTATTTPGKSTATPTTTPGKSTPTTNSTSSSKPTNSTSTSPTPSTSVSLKTTTQGAGITRPPALAIVVMLVVICRKLSQV